MTERTIFMEAVDISDPAARAAFLTQACAGDEPLHRKVTELLAAHEASGDFLQVPAAEQICGTPDFTVVSTDSARSGPASLEFLRPSGKPGSLGVLGHYEILEVVGKGGMGVVLRAFDDRLHRVVAIKVLAPHLASNAMARQRFVREARAAAAINHDNVIAVHAVEDSGPVPYLVMRYVSGQTLQDKLDRTGPPALREVLRIGLQIAEGLAAAHKQGLIHRDVKPANILLENGIERVRITDFGLARAADDNSLTQSGVIAGTPPYMSPEQAEGRPIDARSDLFSLGSVLYALCTGHAPFRAATPIAVLKRVCDTTPKPVRSVNPEIPEWLEAIIARLHAKDPGARFQSAKEVADLLGNRLAQVQASPSSATLRAAPVRRGGPRWLAAAAVLLMGGVVVAAVTYGPGLLSLRKSAEENSNPPIASVPASPLDLRQRRDIPAGLLAMCGGGDPAQAPAELVAVLGDHRFQPLGTKVDGLACSRDGRLLAVSTDRKVQLFDVKTGDLRGSLEVTAGVAFRVNFNSDSTRLLVARGANNKEPAAELWDIPTQKRVRVFLGHTDGVLNAIFGPRDETVITSSMDGTVVIWDAATGERKHRLEHGAHVHGLAVRPDGKVLVTACNDRAVRVWDLHSGTLKHTLFGHTEQASNVCFSPDGKYFATSGGKDIRLWDAQTFAEVRTIPEAGGWLQFSPHSASLYSAVPFWRDDDPHTVLRWEVASGKKLGELRLQSRGSWGHFALTPDARTLFNSRLNPPGVLIHAYDAETGQEFPRQGHLGAVLAVAVHPEGKLLASSGADGTVRLWDVAEWKPLDVWTRPGLGTRGLAFSPDGKRLAAATRDNTIALWDVSRREEVGALAAPVVVDSALVFSPDGKTLAAAAEDGRLRFWDLETQKSRTSPRRHAGAVQALAFSADGLRMATAGADRKVCLSETASGRLLHTFAIGEGNVNLAFVADGRSLTATCTSPPAIHQWNLESGDERTFPAEAVRALAVQPGGRIVATGAADGTVTLRLSDAETQRSLKFADNAGIEGVAFMPAGRYLVTAHANGMVAVLRVPAPPTPTQTTPIRLPDSKELASRPSAADALDAGKIPEELKPEKAPSGLVAVLGDRRLEHRGEITAIRFIDQDRKLVSFGKDHVVRFWDMATGQQQRTVPIQTSEFSGCALNADGTVLALGYDRTGLVKLFELERGTELRQLPNAADRGVLFPGIAFSPDGKKIATGGRWNWCKCWDATTGTELWQTPRQGVNTYAVAFSPDGKTVANGNEDAELNLWDVASGQLRHRLTGHKGAVIAIAFAADGQSLASTGSDGTLRRWDPNEGKSLGMVEAHKKHVHAIATTADGRILATGADELLLWDADKPTPRARLVGHRGYLAALAFTADGKTLASASIDGTIRLWDVERGEARLPRQGHVGRVLATAVTPDGKMLASAGEDRSVKLWDLATARLVHDLRGHPAEVHALAFSPDGQILASQSRDGTVRRWNPITGEARPSPLGEVADGRGVAFSPDGRYFTVLHANGAITLWNLAASTMHTRLTGHRPGVSQVAFSPDGGRLVSVGPDGARMWDVASGWQTAAFAPRAKGYAAATFSPDGQRLVLASLEQKLEICDGFTGAEVGSIAASVGDRLAFRADGRMLVSLGADRLVHLFDFAVKPWPMKPMASVSTPEAVCVTMTPEGRYLAVGKADGTIQMVCLAKRGEATARR